MNDIAEYILFAHDTNEVTTNSKILRTEINNRDSWRKANGLISNYDKTSNSF